MKNILSDMKKVVNLLDRLFKKNMKINIYTPLPTDNDENFDLNILCRLNRLKSSFLKKVTFKDYKYKEDANINIFFNYELTENDSRIRINKDTLLLNKIITITFSYKNKQDLNKMFSIYSNSMEVFLNPLEFNLKNR